MKIKFGTTVVFKNNENTIRLPAAKHPITIREIKVHEIREIIPQIREMNEAKFQQFENRFHKKGDSCFVAYLKNIPVHFSWVRNYGVMGISSAERSYNIPENAIWIFDCRTVETFRGYGIYPAVIAQLSKIFLVNKTAIYIDTSLSNVSSIKGIRKAGFIPVTKIYRLGLFSFAIPGQLK